MNGVQFTPEASRDLDQIEEYISKDDPEAALRLIHRIGERCELLSRHPAAGEDRSELRPGIRSLPVGNYLVFYRPAENGIEVIRVLHGARDVPRFFE